MTRNGLQAARESSAQLNVVIAMVDDAQWEAPSACAGWRVIDVIAHLAALAHEAVDPPAPDPTVPSNRERYHDLRVDQRRGLSHAQVIDEWRHYGPRQLDLLKSDQNPPSADEPVEGRRAVCSFPNRVSSPGPLNCGFPSCLTAMSPRFVSRSTAFPAAGSESLPGEPLQRHIGDVVPAAVDRQ